MECLCLAACCLAYFLAELVQVVRCSVVHYTVTEARCRKELAGHPGLPELSFESLHLTESEHRIDSVDSALPE